MPLITNESEVKKESSYPKYEKTNRIVLLSNLYKINFHYLAHKKNSVLCLGKDDCGYCKAGKFPKRAEYNYVVNLNGQVGIMDIKPSVFFSLNELEEATGKDKRLVRWLVLKSGEGKETRYTVSKDDNLTEDEIKENEINLKENNDRLGNAMLKREQRMEEKYHEFSKEDEEAPAQTGNSEPPPWENGEEEQEQD